MINMTPVDIDGKMFQAIRVQLPKTNLLMIGNDKGYIMCRAVGVRSIDDLLTAPLEKITDASKEYGWEIGMIGKDALSKLV